MESSDLGFEKYLHEAHDYFNHLAAELDHPNEKKRVVIIWRAVMHVIRDRIHIAESLDLISPLPMVLKGLYVEGWKYHESPLYDFETLAQMKTQVKALQNKYGEAEFDWSKPTEEIISITLKSLGRYVPETQLEHIKNMLPDDVKQVVHT
ncbi:MAG: DUF2267 domain-containing protein [Balneolaceae bacterium]